MRKINPLCLSLVVYTNDNTSISRRNRRAFIANDKFGRANMRQRVRHPPATSVSTTFAEYGVITAMSESQFGIYYADARPSNIDCGASAKDDLDWDKEPELDYSQYEDEPGEEQ